MRGELEEGFVGAKGCGVVLEEIGGLRLALHS